MSARWRRCSPFAHVAPLALWVGTATYVASGNRSPTLLAPERSWALPSAQWPLGCGEAGVDLLALVSHGTQRGTLVALTVSLLGFALGCPLGALAALLRGRFEQSVSRLCDLVQAFPTFLLALVVLSAVGRPTRAHLGAVFLLTAWAPFARLSLAQTRVLRDASFIEAARALGAGGVQIVYRHLLPNLLGVVAVQLGSSASAIIVSEASLSFIGFGGQDGISLGAVLGQGVASMLRAPHVLLVGASAVFCTSAAFMMAGRVFAPGFAQVRREH